MPEFQWLKKNSIFFIITAKELTRDQWCFCHRQLLCRVFLILTNGQQLSRVGLLWQNQTRDDAALLRDPEPIPADWMFVPHHLPTYASHPAPHSLTVNKQINKWLVVVIFYAFLKSCHFENYSNCIKQSKQNLSNRWRRHSTSLLWPNQKHQSTLRKQTNKYYSNNSDSPHHFRAQIIQSYLPGGIHLIHGSVSICKSALHTSSWLV